MNLLRQQKPYELSPPRYASWFRPVLHLVSALTLTCLRRNPSLDRVAETILKLEEDVLIAFLKTL